MNGFCSFMVQTRAAQVTTPMNDSNTDAGAITGYGAREAFLINARALKHNLSVTSCHTSMHPAESLNNTKLPRAVIHITLPLCHVLVSSMHWQAMTLQHHRATQPLWPALAFQVLETVSSGLRKGGEARNTMPSPSFWQAARPRGAAGCLPCLRGSGQRGLPVSARSGGQGRRAEASW